MKSYIIIEFIIYVNIFEAVWAQRINNETEPTVLSGNSELMSQTVTQTPKTTQMLTEYETTTLNSSKTTSDTLRNKTIFGITESSLTDYLGNTTINALNYENQTEKIVNYSPGNTSSITANNTIADERQTRLLTHTMTTAPNIRPTIDDNRGSDLTELSVNSSQVRYFSDNATTVPHNNQDQFTTVPNNYEEQFTTVPSIHQDQTTTIPDNQQDQSAVANEVTLKHVNVMTANNTPVYDTVTQDVFAQTQQSTNTDSIDTTTAFTPKMTTNQSNEQINGLLNETKNTELRVEMTEENGLKTDTTIAESNYTYNQMTSHTTQTPIQTTFMIPKVTETNPNSIPTSLNDNNINESYVTSQQNYSLPQVLTHNPNSSVSHIQTTVREDRTLYLNASEIETKPIQNTTNPIMTTQTTKQKPIEGVPTELPQTVSQNKSIPTVGLVETVTTTQSSTLKPMATTGPLRSAPTVETIKSTTESVATVRPISMIEPIDTSSTLRSLGSVTTTQSTLNSESVPSIDPFVSSIINTINKSIETLSTVAPVGSVSTATPPKAVPTVVSTVRSEPIQTNQILETTKTIESNQSNQSTEAPNYWTETTQSKHTTQSPVTQREDSVHSLTWSEIKDLDKITTDRPIQTTQPTQPTQPTLQRQTTESITTINRVKTTESMPENSITSDVAKNDSELPIDSKTTFQLPLVYPRTTEYVKPITTSIPYESNISSITVRLPNIIDVNSMNKTDITNIVTITFTYDMIKTFDIFRWVSIYDPKFRNFTCNCIDPQRNWCTIDRIIYVLPSHHIRSYQFVINFFVDDSKDNDLTNFHVFAGSVVVDAMKNSTHYLNQEMMGLKVLSLQTNLGTIVVKPLEGPHDRIARFELLVFIFTVVMFICTVLLCLAIICSCAKRKSVDVNQIELYNANRRQTGINGGFDLNSATNILRDENNKKRNHNVINLEDGWVAPIDHVIDNNPKITKYDSLQDTKL